MAEAQALSKCRSLALFVSTGLLSAFFVVYLFLTESEDQVFELPKAAFRQNSSQQLDPRLKEQQDRRKDGLKEKQQLDPRLKAQQDRLKDGLKEKQVAAAGQALRQETNRVLLVDGCQRTGGTLLPRLPAAGEAAGVACCEDLDLAALVRTGACQASELGCKRATTLPEARRICSEAGLRLCSQLELEMGACCAATIGCSFDRQRLGQRRPLSNGFEGLLLWSQTLGDHEHEGDWYSTEGQWMVSSGQVFRDGEVQGALYVQEDHRVQMRWTLYGEAGAFRTGSRTKRGDWIVWDNTVMTSWSRHDPRGFYLVTSMLQSEAHKHSIELAKALARNLFNPVILQVHVLVENHDGSNDVEWLRTRLTDVIPNTVKAVTSAEIGQALAKLVLVNTPKTPLYCDFFKYANDALLNYAVMVSNTDVVFDESLRLIDQQQLLGNRAFLLSVSQPPVNGEYLQAFGEECSLEPRCTIGRLHGWYLGGASWDVYIFRSPVHNLERYMGDLAFPMFHMGAENRAGWVLAKKIGLSITNPCIHVKAYHWHCQGEKMHDADPFHSPIPKTPFHNMVPCWDCPGVRLPPGAVSLGFMCMRGNRVSVSGVFGRWKKEKRKVNPEHVRAMFRYPEKTEICCEAGGGADCQKVWDKMWANTPQATTKPDWKKHYFMDEITDKAILAAAVPHCYSEYDVNCIISNAQATKDDGNNGN